MTDATLHITIKGHEYVLTREQAARLARRMAEREADEPAVWGEVGMLLLDFAGHKR